MSIVFGARQPCDLYRSGDASQPCARQRQRWVLVTSVLGSSLAFVEGSIVNLALPSMQADLGLDSIGLQWIVNAYLLALSSLLLIGGAAGDRYGLRLVFIVGLTLFGMASGACAVVNAAPVLIVFRALQGVGAALLVPTSLALINVHFSREDRGRAIGVWAGASALTSALGPLLGGGLVDLFDWRAVFLVMVPLSTLAVLIAATRVPERRGKSQPLDMPGATLFVIALSLLTYGLVEIGSSTLAWPALLLGAVALITFLGFEKRASAPMLPLRLFDNLSFTGANIMTVLLYFALGGALYFVPFNLIQVQGYTALQAGAAFLPLTLLLGFGSAAAGRLLNRYSPRTLLSVGAMLTAAGLWLLALPSSDSTYFASWFPGILVMGIGMTLCVAPLTTVVMGSVSDAESGTASGVNNTAARTAGLLAVALLTAFAVDIFERDLGEALSETTMSDQAQARLIAQSGSLAALGAAEDDNAQMVRSIVEETYVGTFRILMVLCGCFAFAAALVARFTVPGDITREGS